MPTKNDHKATDKKYIETIGRRKNATARVRLYTASKQTVVVNEKDYTEYFKTTEQRAAIEAPFKAVEMADTFKVTAKVAGGGLSAQADAIRHGIARALVRHDETQRTNLKKAGYLKRDPRTKERKKPGLKKARKSAQWSKR